MIPHVKFFRKVFVFMIVVITASAISPFTLAASFTDVEPRYQEAVDFLVSKGINGRADGTFGTHQNIKRVDAAIFVVKALDLDIELAPTSGFTDVPERAAKEVNALKAAGITSGKTKTTFGSSDLITRGELAVWLTKAFELESVDVELVFTDVAERYINDVKALVYNEITKGTSETTFGTHDKAKRGDFAIFVYKACQIKDKLNAPAIKSINAVNGKQIELTFSTALDVEEAAYIAKTGNRIVVYTASESVASANFISEMISFSDDRKTAMVILKPRTATQADQELAEGKAYTVALVSDYGDHLSFAQVEAKSDPAVLLKGLEVPKVEVSEEQDYVIVEFSQRMDQEVKNLANYEVFDNYGVIVQGPFSHAEWIDVTTKTAVKLKMNPGVLSAGKTYKLKISPNLESESGSKLPLTQLVTAFKTPTIIEAQPRIELARITGTNEITITFDQDLFNRVMSNVSMLEVKRLNNTTIDVNKISFLDKNLVLTTSEKEAFDEGFAYTISLPSGIAVNDQFRNAVSDTVSDIEVVAVKNEAATSVRAEFVREKRDKEKADLHLAFDHAVKVEDIAAGDIKIESYGKTYFIAADTKVEIFGEDPSGKTLVIKDISNAFAMDYTDTTTKAATKFVPEDGESYRVIVEGNVAKSIAPVIEEEQKSNQADLQTIVAGIDIEAPKIQEVTLHSAEKITIQFNENIIASGLEDSDIKVKGFIKSAGARYEAATLTGSSSLEFSVSGDKLTITSAADSVKFQTGAVEIGETIMSIGADTLKDANGIENENMEYIITDNDTNLYDKAAPIMIGSKITDVLSGALEVTYSEDVYAKSGTGAEAAKQFNVSGVERNTTGASSTVSTSAGAAQNVFEVIFTNKTFTFKDYSSANLIYTHNVNYTIQDVEQNHQASGSVIGILNPTSAFIVSAASTNK
ncbi:S-layer homology domain-containing protein [Domibacillus sp. DTU_2020_1001157_1_SI_ALB_TIR_016]|uniref:S-layer homology domain-containing protein n=1 Tax=Domibacillus sp. DTU_2020_1001157_1_SI_ALB_TIR_016 TaxID=3077789 RepID=UPI0028F0CC1B|nr:S-layer homology domain-containing protein [Domibacillus sp. DTU_2020_1001157_1_SI_ALB_TIR_016]WNS81160.1 S-layer homology domain-containing protein [Domibacillus sp. DTU_2020_1001157_1_SI_ALB_TIR_016]